MKERVMKDKHKVEYLRELATRLLDDLSVRVSTETGSPCLFAIQEVDALVVKGEQTEEEKLANEPVKDHIGFGFLVEFAEPNKLPTVLYRRAYKLGLGLTKAQLTAYEEFLRTAINLYSGFSLQTMMNKEAEAPVTSGLSQVVEEVTEQSPVTEQENGSN